MSAVRPIRDGAWPAPAAGEDLWDLDPAPLQDHVGEPDREGEDGQAHRGSGDAQRDQGAGQVERQLHGEAGREDADPDPARPRVDAQQLRVLPPGHPGAAEARPEDDPEQRPADQDRDQVHAAVEGVEQQAREEKSSARPVRSAMNAARATPTKPASAKRGDSPLASRSAAIARPAPIAQRPASAIRLPPSA